MIVFAALPRTVKIFCTNHGGWIVGGAAINPNNLPRDWDVMIPWNDWHLAAALIPENAVRNTYGGWKFTEDGVTIDVWPDTLERLIVSSMFKAAYHPATGIRVLKEKHTL